MVCSGVLGFALAAKGKDAVIWAEIDEDEIFPLQGVAAVVISWIFSPVCSGIVSAFFFFVVRATVLRAKNSFKLAWFALPVFVGLTFFINAFYVLDKGVSKQWEDSTTAKSAWIGALIGVFFFIITIPIAMFLKHRFIKQEDEIVDEMKAIQGADAAEKGVANGEKAPGARCRLSAALRGSSASSAGSPLSGVRALPACAWRRRGAGGATATPGRYFLAMNAILVRCRHGRDVRVRAVCRLGREEAVVVLRAAARRGQRERPARGGGGDQHQGHPRPRRGLRPPRRGCLPVPPGAPPPRHLWRH